MYTPRRSVALRESVRRVALAPCRMWIWPNWTPWRFCSLCLLHHRGDPYRPWLYGNYLVSSASDSDPRERFNCVSRSQHPRQVSVDHDVMADVQSLLISIYLLMYVIQWMSFILWYIFFTSEMQRIFIENSWRYKPCSILCSFSIMFLCCVLIVVLAIKVLYVIIHEQ